ncbi:MAG: GAF domain-containing protein, partial [Nitrospinales bacterium]
MSSSRILTQLLELTSNTTNAFTAALFVADPRQRVLTLRENFTLSGNLNKNARISYGEGPIGRVAENEKPFLEEHFNGDSAALKMYTEREDLKSFLAVPVAGDGLAGVLAVDSKESYCFSIRSQKLVAGFAQQMAWHLAEEAKTTRPTSGNSFPYLDFIKYNRFIIEALTPAAMAERLIRIPPSILRCDAMAVVWLEKSDGVGKIICHQGWGRDLDDREIIAGTSVAGACIRDEIPILSRELEECRTVLFWEKERLEGFKVALSIPIRFRGHLLAVLVFAAKEPDALSSVDLERMNMVGTMAAPALFYAREKRKWDFDKNLDPITHIPNHRYLVKCRE